MSRPTRDTLTDKIARLHTSLIRDGVAINDMRRAPSLELQYADALDGRLQPPRAIGIEPLEGPIQSCYVPRISPRESRLRYFLDGSQRTFLAWRCNTIPILATVAAAAILQRDNTGNCDIVPGSLRLNHAMIAPRGLSDPKLQHVLDRIEDHGLRIIDPFQSDSEEDAEPSPEGPYTEYGHLVERSYRAARGVRTSIELELLNDWGAGNYASDQDGWLVADGRLHLPAPRAVGLVKQFTDAYLVGPDAAMMLGLPPGYRTTAFFPHEDRRRHGPDPEARTLWYLRLWDASGLDARHALVRVETAATVRTTREIDEISSWIWADRTPRATNDERWATLLYPVHYLERILKRCIEADTRGWPSA